MARLVLFRRLTQRREGLWSSWLQVLPRLRGVTTSRDPGPPQGDRPGLPRKSTLARISFDMYRRPGPWGSVSADPFHSNELKRRIRRSDDNAYIPFPPLSLLFSPTREFYPPSRSKTFSVQIRSITNFTKFWRISDSGRPTFQINPENYVVLD